ncbi:probable apyrase 7 [Magnolia sinica]|uniref:probable apyrase 7 n=1 Tax=Magnolia sinica TaxID=86752 RepID=UPI002657E25D|nr:probable apyrase 7 [Magnolia sinica]XP_058089678.1 probable apyrase 7 [Magnolia sinica]XP_058089679.1 probable apyrase 7 [Magnolia sinica]
MGASRIAAIVSAAVSRITHPHSSTGPSVSPSFLPPAGSNHRFGLASPGQKGGLRLSASLQDFSTFCMLDPEEGDLDLGIDSLTHAKPPRALQRETFGSSFSKEKTLPATSFARKKWVRAATCLLCLLLFFFLIYAFSRHFSTRPSQFYVILDCGSTSTRIYVYEWSIGHKTDHENLPIFLKSLPESIQRKSSSRSGRAYQRMETEPGLDKLVWDMSGLTTAMNPLLEWAEKQIPKHAHKTTPLFLYATAGVRRLPPDDSKELLDKAWSILRNSSFLCQKDWIKIITGMEEAYYGWIALNYHMGTLGSSPTKETFGALDLGGSSLQVTFETEEVVHDESSLNLSIGAVKHHLSAYSLPGYGLNDAFDKTVVHLLKKLSETTKVDLNKGKIELKHPCLQTGYKEQYICSQCVELNQEGSPLMEGRSTGNGKTGTAIELVGAPQWDECSALAKITVNLSEWSHLSSALDCELQPCALKENLPQPSGQFYAMSGFFVVFKFFNLTSDAMLEDVLQKGQEFCESTWEVAKNSVVPQPFIEQYCFRAPYIVSLLRQGLHITDKQVVIGSGSITWTLGVALLEAGRALPSRMELNSYRLLYMKLNPAILIALLLLSLMLLICAFLWIGNCVPRFFRGPHLPLFRQRNGGNTSVPSPFRFQRWSPISSGDGRVKLPLSPKIAGSEQRPFGMGHGLGAGSIQLMESNLYPSVSHSYSSGSLGQMQFENGVGSFWTQHRGQMRLQSRRSQSREDLSSSLAETHMGKA